MKPFLKEFLLRLNLPNKNEVKLSINSLKKRDYFIFLIALVVLVFSILGIINKINNNFSIQIPAYGGTIKEGVIGNPRFVNPLLALSDADKDLTAIVYSGLMKRNINGDLVSDLALNYEISKDGLIYTFTLRDDIYFHDKKKVTVDDVLFTIESAKDILIKSPKKINWDGVLVEKTEDNKIKFTLKQQFAGFLENTTIGILPKHLWTNIPPNQWNLNDLNINPIGSGPFKIIDINKKAGIPISYSLVAFTKYVDGRPFIKNLKFNFYDNETDLLSAFKNNEIDNINSISPIEAENLSRAGFTTKTSVLPRIFGLFFNQSEAPIFTDKNIIKAIEKAIDKEKIIKEVLNGYGKTINSPLPPSMINYMSLSSAQGNFSETFNPEESYALLEASGWKIGSDGIREKEKLTVIEKKSGKKTSKETTKEVTKLSFSISTSDIPELKKATELVAEDLRRIGVNVEIKIFEIGNLNQNIIRPRKYDVLFFGQIINQGSDLFAFWHSSQKNDPGLNIALYTNAKVDKILESLLTSMNGEDRAKKYLDFQSEIKKDEPAIFIYSPEFVYVTRNPIKGLYINNLKGSQDRFGNIANWYTKTDHIWKIFQQE